MTELTNLTIKDALGKLEAKEISAVDLTQAHIERMATTKELNAYVTETPDKAMEMAKASDARRTKGEAGKLDGIPISVKDLFCTKDVRTTACAKILENFVPTYESHVTQNLWNDGAVLLGKVNHDQFGMGSTTSNTHFGNTINPWRAKSNPERPLVPGGSSGGSSVSVAAGSAMASTGTDTGGSCRQPAAFCGVVGFKPTYGRCSRWGIISYASSLDQAGVLTRSVEDTALMMESMAGFDPMDSTSANKEVPNWASQITGDVKGLKIGIPADYKSDGLSGDVTQWWEKAAAMLKDAGAEIIDVELPGTQYALPAYYILAPAEASSNLARYDGVRYGSRVDGKDLIEMYSNTRADGFREETKRRIMIGTYALSAGYYDAYYRKAQQVRRLVLNGFESAYEKCDILLTPVAPTPAFGFDENTDDPVQMYLQDIFTIPASLAGLPGMSLPVGLSADGLPIGLQLIGKRWDEATVFQVGRALEEAANFKEVAIPLTKVAA